MNNKDIAHKFFYSVKEAKSANSVSYRGNNFYSYSTIIAKKYKGYLFTSNYYYSNTTAKHRSILISASPLPVLYAPVLAIEDKTESNFEKLIISEFRRILDTYRSFEKKEIIKNCLEVIEQAQAIEEALKIKILLKKHLVLKEKLQSKDFIKEQRAKAKAKAIKEAKALERTKKDIARNFDSLILGYQNQWKAQSQEENEANYKKRQQLKLLQGYSFVWYDLDDKCIRTSQSVRITEEEEIKKAYLFLKRYFKNEDLNGLKISYYTIVKHTEDFLQIGCHKIAKFNLIYLLEQLEAIFAEGNR